MKNRVYTALGTVALAGATLAAQNLTINGAGATFPAPIYAKWFSEYNKLHSNVRINQTCARAIGRSLRRSCRSGR